MLNRILHIILSLLILANLTIISVSANENAQIIVSSATIEKGTSNVDITISLRNNPGIVSAKLTIDFNSDVMTLVKVADAGILGNASHSPALDSPYNLYWNNATATNNFDIDGTIVTLSFTINDNTPSGNYPIYISYDEDNVLNSNMDNVNFETTNGYVTVKNSNINNKPSISVGGLSFDDLSFDIILDAGSYNGKILAALYSQDGRLQNLKLYQAEPQVRITFDRGKTGAYVKIMWWESLNSLKPLCAPQTIYLQ